MVPTRPKGKLCMGTRYRYLLSFLILLGISLWEAPAVPAPVAPAVTYAKVDFMGAIDDWTWADEKWTGDDRPFAAARLSIDRVFNASQNTSDIVSKYAQLAAENPQDALDQFRWAYSLFKQLQIPHSQMMDPSDIFKVELAIAAADQPHCYNYTRLRLLYEPDAPQERSLDERLLKYDPSDVLVKSIYAFTLSESKIKLDDDNAVSIEQGIVADGKYIPTCYRDIGYIYYNVGCSEGNMEYYRKSIAASRQFLALTPEYDCRRADVEHSIAYLTKRVAENKL